MTSDKRTATISLDSLKQKNAGKVQFNAVRKEIFALLDKGYSRRALHAVLREKGLFTGSYRRFCEYVQGIGKREYGQEAPESALAAPGKITHPAPVPQSESVTPPKPTPTAPTTPQEPRQEKPASSGFVHSTPNHSDLF